jgi:hypothetical protein
LPVPDGVLDCLADLVATKFADRCGQPEPSPSLNIPEAAVHLRASRQRFDHLKGLTTTTTTRPTTIRKE